MPGSGLFHGVCQRTLAVLALAVFTSSEGVYYRRLLPSIENAVWRCTPQKFSDASLPLAHITKSSVVQT